MTTPDPTSSTPPAATATPEPQAPAGGGGGDIVSRIQAKLAAAEAPPAPAAAPEPAPAPQVKPETAPAPASPEVPEIEPELADVEPTVADLGLPIDAPATDGNDDDATSGDEPSTPDGRAFKTLRTELKSEKAARAALEAKARELEAKIAEREATTPDVAALEAKIAEYEKTISVTRLEMSPAYKAAVEEPYRQIVTKADEFAEKYDIDKIELTEALGITDRKERAAKLKDLLVGVEDLDKLEILDLGREVEKVAAKQKELLENADKALAELEAEQTRQKQEELAARVAERKTAVSQVLPHMASRLPSFKDAILGLQDSLADTDFTALPAVKQAYHVAAGELLPTILKDRNRIQKDLESALDELRALREAAPGSGGGGGGGGNNGGSGNQVGGDTFADRVKARLQGVA